MICQVELVSLSSTLACFRFAVNPSLTSLPYARFLVHATLGVRARRAFLRAAGFPRSHGPTKLPAWWRKGLKLRLILGCCEQLSPSRRGRCRAGLDRIRWSFTAGRPVPRCRRRSCLDPLCPCPRLPADKRQPGCYSGTRVFRWGSSSRTRNARRRTRRPPEG